MRLYAINVRWVKTTQDEKTIQRVDTAIHKAGDWVRFNGFTWLVWTSANAIQLTALVRNIVTDPEDSVLVIGADPSDFYGWAPNWIWEWLRDKQIQSQNPLLSSVLSQHELF